MKLAGINRLLLTRIARFDVVGLNHPWEALREAVVDIGGESGDEFVEGVRVDWWLGLSALLVGDGESRWRKRWCR
ncbi:hypothetical protein Bca4012_036937 [Brassica carinata]